MTTVNPTANEIKTILRQAADEKIRKKIEHWASGTKCIGFLVPRIRELSKAFSQKNTHLTIEETCAVMDSLADEKCREEILFGVFLLARFKKKVWSIPWEKINRWLDAVDNWETCDQLASNIAAPIVVHHLPQIEQLKQIARSPDFWKRRFAAAVAANINHGGGQFPGETLAICKILLADEERMVTKAVAWAIREASKKSPDLVFDFLKANRKNISARLLNESSEKLPADLQRELNPVEM